MATELFETIRRYLENSEYDFDIVEHDPVYTSEEARETLGHEPMEGTKSLVLDSESRLVVVTVPEPQDVDFDQISELTNTSGLEMCDPDVVEEELATEIGGIAPFGYGDDVITVVSSRLFGESTVYFNPGRNDVTAKVTGDVFERIARDWDATTY